MLIFFSVCRGIVGFAFAQDVIDSREQPSGDGDDGLFLAAPLLEGLLLPVDFRMFLAAAGSKRDLDQQGLEISAGFANAGGFLLTCALRVLRGKASPGAEMPGGVKYRHVSANLSKDANRGKSITDARNGQEQFDLRKVILRNLKDKGFQFRFAFFQRIHVAADDFELFRLLMGKDAVNRFLDLRDRRFAAPVYKGSHVKRLSGMLQQLRCDGG